MENKDPVPHNVAIYESEARAEELFNGELLNEVGTITYDVPALAAGPYYFICIVHPNMEGTLTAQ
jgi:plastocyanin